ncbi:MAG: glycosyl transferase family 4 [Nanoarchaeota archaeon]|nr:glycosyl transferase family 4 [Nanoarchaeota archaeon]MBU4456412.1 glycosyl transferase family 4 [Nanoarchaeota archaeon]MCG2720191.1 glycosyl transferase family 4 [Nanoarchaeota archaeon]
MIFQYPIILLSFTLSLIFVSFLMPHWIKRAKKAGLIGKDMNKPDKREVAELGGIIVLFAFILGTLFYIAVDTFFIEHTNLTSLLGRDLTIMAALATILLVGIIGMVDDILGWKIGLRQMQKPFLVLFASLPMVVVNAGHSTLALPLIGQINIGVLFPLLVVPIAISAAANGFNMLAGYNGLEAGMGTIILSILSFLAWKNNNPHIAVMGLCMVFALIAFYYFNKFPAKVFPGNTLTYSVGAMVAVLAITANLERAALFLFIPYFIELILKARGKMQKESFAKVNEDGSLETPYNKVYGLEHLSIKLLKKIKNKVYEKDVVYSIFAFEILLGIIYFGFKAVV